MLETKESLAALLFRFAPVGGSKVSVDPLTKLLPVIVSVLSVLEAGSEVGDMELILGAGPSGT